MTKFLAAAIIVATFLPSYAIAAECYILKGGRCAPNRSSGYDSTCTYRCIVSITSNGEKVVKLYKNHHWEIQ
jgi:hypothetical protein